MKIFFYTADSPQCSESCSYRYCSKNYFHKLQRLNSDRTYHCLTGPLAYGRQGKKPFPRRGDIIILYAENSGALERMNSNSESFEGLKKVLVVADVAGIDGEMFHKLSPRYITQANRAVEELTQVVQRMKSPVNSTL